MFSSPSLWIFRFFTFVWFLHWVIKLVFQSITTPFTGLGYLSICHHLKNTAHENIPQIAQVRSANGTVSPLLDELHDLFLCEVLSACMRTKLLVSCWRNWVYIWKKVLVLFSYWCISYDRKQCKRKTYHFFTECSDVGWHIASTELKLRKFPYVQRVKNSSCRLCWWNGLHI